MPSSHNKCEEGLASEQDDSNANEINGKTSNFYDVYGPQVLFLSLFLKFCLFVCVVFMNW